VTSPFLKRRDFCGCWLSWLLLPGLLLGCTRYDVASSAGTEAAAAIQKLPAQLVSELVVLPGKEPALDCDLSVRNDATVRRDLVFEQTGCSCYGIADGQQQLARGDRIAFAPGETRSLRLGVKPARQRSQLEYRAAFHWEGPEGHVPLQLEARLAVYDDVQISPPALSRNLTPAELQHSFREVFDLVRVARDREQTQAMPAVDISSESVAVEKVWPDGDAESMEDGLWKQTWKLAVQITPPADLKPDTFPVHVRGSFPGPEGTEMSDTAQVLLRLKMPLQYPESIYLGRIPAGQLRARKVLIRSTDEEPFELSVANESAKQVGIHINAEMRTEHWVELSVTPAEVGEFAYHVQLNATHPRMPRLQLQVSGAGFLPPSE